MRKHLWSVSAFALLAAFASEAQAQTATPPVADDGGAAAAVPAGDQDSRKATQYYTGAIVVTASKRAENLSDAPLSINAIARKSVVWGKQCSVPVDIGGLGTIQKIKR